MKRNSKRILALLVCLLMLCSMIPQVMAAPAADAPTVNLAALQEGVTVSADSASPTGYTATFVYKDATATNVQLYSDLMYFYKLSENATVTYRSFQWTKDMFNMNHFSGGGAYRENMMKQAGTDLWVLIVPLPSGHFSYRYVVDGVNKVDPANPPLINSKTNRVADYSMVYMPFDASRQSKDMSVETPRANQKGKVVYETYTGFGGATRPLAIYLPYGYDKNRTEPYKVIYLSHGGGGDEMDWLNDGCVPNIMDNLVAEGKTEPAIVVCMDNTALGWNFDNIIDDQMNSIIPFMEANYNASNKPQDRAYSGLSMGGMTTSTMWYKKAAQFGYFGILSGCNNAIIDLNAGVDLDKPVLYLGAGLYDFGYQGTGDFPIMSLARKLDAKGMPYKLDAVPGSHDWVTWPLLFRTFAEDILWQSKDSINFDVHTEVFDYGQAVTAVVIDANGIVDGASIDANSFKVSAINKNPNNDAVVYDGARKVTKAYVSDSKTPGSARATGRYIILELENGFTVNGSSALVYTGGRNVKLDMNYSVERLKEVKFADGSSLSSALSLKQDKVVTPIFDDFEYVQYDGAFFRVYTPEGAEGKKLPIVVWNHGAGETYQNENNEGVQLLANFGGIGWVKNAPEDCYVIAPQRGYAGYAREKVIAYITEMIAAGKVDPDRVYLAGCSAGGAETWNYLLDDTKREFFAAAIPCPGGNNSSAEVLKKVVDFPIWMVQTGNDTYASTKAAYDKLKAMNANVHWTSFPVGYNGYPNDHWSWVPTLNNFFAPEVGMTIMQWLFKQVNNRNTFELVKEVKEYGQNVTALIIDTNDVIKASSVALDTFTVSALNKNPNTGATAYNGPREVTKAYVSNTKELGKSAETGRYIVLELKWGFTVAGATSLIYTSSRNFSLNMNYTVTQTKPVVTGSDVSIADLKPVQVGAISPVVDDFAYIRYQDTFFRLYSPPEEADGKALPLVIWNHGAGETYSNNYNEAAQILANMGGVGLVVNNKYPAYVLAPQRGTGTNYSQAKIIAYVDAMIAAGKVDSNRVYVAGCSAGGAETINFLRNYPDYFAAAVPICAAAALTTAIGEGIKDVPTWFVHAANDPTVRVQQSRDSVATFGALNPYDLKYTEYTSVFGTDYPNYNGHWSWVMFLNNDFVAAENTNYFDWMFAQSRAKVTDYTVKAEVNGDVTIKVSTTHDITKFLLANEQGMPVSITSATKTAVAGGRLEWTLKTKVGTAGERVLTLLPVSATYGMRSGKEIGVTITNPVSSIEIKSAKFVAASAKVNVPVNIEVVTGDKATGVQIKNTSGSDIGKTQISKIKNADGTITWVYSIKIGTAGNNRQFNVYAVDGKGGVSEPKAISINVTLI